MYTQVRIFSFLWWLQLPKDIENRGGNKNFIQRFTSY